MKLISEDVLLYGQLVTKRTTNIFRALYAFKNTTTLSESITVNYLIQFL